MSRIPTFVNHYKQELPVGDREFLFKMEQKHFWHVGRRELIYDVLKRNGLTGKSMLEVGCGNGSVLSFLKSKSMNIEGADIEMEALKYCRQREPSVMLYHVDISYMPITSHYDVIGAFDVLEHIEDDVKALQSIHKALKPKGMLLLTVPTYPLLWSSFDVVALHKRRYTKKAICDKLEKNGYRVLKASYFVFFLLPVIALFRLMRRDTDTDCSNIIEMKTIPVINEVFLLLLRLEKLLIRKFNLPFGSSIIILAEKL